MSLSGVSAERCEEVAKAARRRFDKDWITAAHVAQVVEFRGWSIWSIDQWIWDQLRGEVDA